MAPNGRDERLQTTFRRAVDEGEVRLERRWSSLLATGFIGGIEVGLGVLALLVIEAETGSRLLGALGFGIGFVALTLGRSELFTENFLVPVAAVVGRRSALRLLLRLWAGTLVMNLVGGWLVAGLIVSGLPRIHPTAVEASQFYLDLGIGWTSFALALVGGAAITVMTWMERGAKSEFGTVVAAWSIGFLLAAAPLNHVIVVSLELFAALQGGAPFGYAQWAATAGWATLGNMVGGLLLVTLLRLVQVGAPEIQDERRRSGRDRR